MADPTPNLPTREGLRTLLGVQGDYDTLGMAALAFGETILANAPQGDHRVQALADLCRSLANARWAVYLGASEPAPAQAEEG